MVLQNLFFRKKSKEFPSKCSASLPDQQQVFLHSSVHESLHRHRYTTDPIYAGSGRDSSKEEELVRDWMWAMEKEEEGATSQNWWLEIQGISEKQMKSFKL